jgi:hypothetical protein
MKWQDNIEMGFRERCSENDRELELRVGRVQYRVQWRKLALAGLDFKVSATRE